MDPKAIYAFSGDPITNGHIDIIKRALESFGSLLVAIGDNPEKKYLFTRDQRVQMTSEALKSLPNVKVVPFEGMLTDFAYEHKIEIIVRGIRNATDFDYEKLLFQLGKTQKQGMDFHFLLANPDLVHISSGATKALQLEQGDISDYVPYHVKAALEKKISGQMFLGVTGEIAAGKTYFSNALEKLMNSKGIPCHHIDLDLLAYEIFEQADEPIYKDIRNRLVEKIGDGILSKNGFVDRKELGKLIFESPASLQTVNQIMLEPMALKLKRAIYKKHGLIILNSALLAEAQWTHYCNNKIILIKTPLETRLQRLSERGWTEPQIKQRVSAQFKTETKIKSINAEISKRDFGKLWQFENCQENFPELLEGVARELIDDLEMEPVNHEQLSVG